MCPQAARCVVAAVRLGLGGSLIAVPIPADAEADGAAVEAATSAALREAEETGVRASLLTSSHRPNRRRLASSAPPRPSSALTAPAHYLGSHARAGVRQRGDAFRPPKGG